MRDFIIKTLGQIFAEDWVALVVGAGGVLLSFAVCLTVGLTTGDFVKNSRAAQIVAKGEIENGLKKLKSFAPAYDKTREISPPESAFDYEKIIGFPYSYSWIKKLPSVTLAATAFFTFLAAAASLVQAGELTHYTSFMLIFVPFIGFVLYITSLFVAGAVLKKATRQFFAMTGLIRDVNVRPAGEVTAASEFVSEKVIEICARIENIAVSGGANHESLSRLYNEILTEKEKYPDGEAGERLAAALDVLNVLIDSALN